MLSIFNLRHFIEKLQAAADARAEAEAAAAHAVGDQDDADADMGAGAGAGAGVQSEDDAAAATATAAMQRYTCPEGKLGNLPELLAEIVEEEIIRNKGIAAELRSAGRAGAAQSQDTVSGVGNGYTGSDGRGRRGGGVPLPPPLPGASSTHAYDALLRALHVAGRG